MAAKMLYSTNKDMIADMVSFFVLIIGFRKKNK